MKKSLKFIIPKGLYDIIRSIVRYIRLSRAYLYDLNHYYTQSMSVDNASEKKLIAKIILDTHVIEKGLTMPDTRLGFGGDRLSGLLSNIVTFTSNFDKSNPQLLHALSVVNEYFDLHQKNNHQLDENLMVKFGRVCEIEKEYLLKYENRNQKDMTKDSYFEYCNSSFYEFSNSRSSIRNFSKENIGKNKILEVLRLSRNTPSACNRQSIRIHLYTKRNEIDEILKVQGGNRGFGHLTNFLLVITYECSMYFEESERNSGYVDGGMYCMNILYALHSNKIAGCILNAANDRNKDIEMRKVAKIPNSEAFVAMIACGIPPDNFKIATSFRYPLENVLAEH